VHLLRTALRAEEDPALRLAIAECVHLSDPDGDTSARTFLDAIPADPQVLVRLWTAGAAEDPRPVLPSLGDLAGEGTPDALAKLVELAAASLLDPALGAAIGDALAGVAASAPAELVAALRAAPAVAQDAAIGALGGGLARSEERDHPFPAALHALAQKDGEEGAFARTLEPRVADAVKASRAARAAPALVPAGGTVPASAAAGR
jgi:D-alanyl-D-alanine carboxypeptidase/D-alanyl-D-alanine-endopeptidase (penicillin-binding protein 4)